MAVVVVVVVSRAYESFVSETKQNRAHMAGFELIDCSHLPCIFYVAVISLFIRTLHLSARHADEQILNTVPAPWATDSGGFGRTKIAGDLFSKKPRISRGPAGCQAVKMKSVGGWFGPDASRNPLP